MDYNNGINIETTKSEMKNVGTLQKVNTVLMTILGFLLVTLYTKMDTAIKKIDNVHDWKTAQTVSIRYRDLKLKDLEMRVENLEDLKHPATSNRYTNDKARLDYQELQNWVSSNFIKKPKQK